MYVLSILSIITLFSLSIVYASESLQTGETIDDVQNTFGWFVLAMSLFIVFAYITGQARATPGMAATATTAVETTATGEILIRGLPSRAR
jgi:hypothetical protein